MGKEAFDRRGSGGYNGAIPFLEETVLPLIVDKDAVRREILLAYERCMEKKPMPSVSLRDIAAEAGMSHVKLLHYFESREAITVAYVRYTREYMSERCTAWFETHPRSDYASNLAYMNAFMEYVANAPAGETRPRATTQTYVMGRYSEEIARLVAEEFAEWRAVMERCLKTVYGGEMPAEAEAMMILIAGTFICNYNRVLTGGVNADILGALGRLSES